MMQDDRRFELAGEFTHAMSAGLFGRGSVGGLSSSVDEHQEIVAAQDEETLGSDVEKM